MNDTATQVSQVAPIVIMFFVMLRRLDHVNLARDLILSQHVQFFCEEQGLQWGAQVRTSMDFHAVHSNSSKSASQTNAVSILKAWEWGILAAFPSM